MGPKTSFDRRIATALTGAVLIAVAILGATALIDRFAGDAYESDVRAIVSRDADALARNLSDIVARETATVDALAALVENEGGDPEGLRTEFPLFAEALMELGQTITSVQLAPDGILDYVYPVEGNEAAVGLDLMADDDRRALLEPAITSGATVIQGPVELVQGGTGLIVRRPIYVAGSYWGFSAVVLDWHAFAELSGLTTAGEFTISGVRLADSGRVIAGSAEAFEGDPIIRELEVGGTDTTWVLAERPVDGWPSRSAEAPFIWAVGIFLAGVSGFLSYSLIRRPEMLRRERERVLAELEVIEARYQATFENAGVGIVITDLSGRLLSANPRFREIVGVDEDTATEDIDVVSMIGEEQQEVRRHKLGRLLAGATVSEQEVRLKTPNIDRWCLVRKSLIPGDRADEPLVMAIVEDTTERRRAEDALAESELRFRQLFDLAPIAIQREDHSAVKAEVARLTANGVTDLRAHAEANPDWLKGLLAQVPIVDENRAAAVLQQTPDSGGRTLTLLDRYTKAAESTFIETMVAISEDRNHIKQEVETLRRDGSPLYMDLRWHAPVVDGAPDYSNVLVSLVDITELKETGQRLRRLMESKDRFLASVAHELRTPLTAVVGFAEELNNGTEMYSSGEKAEFRELIAFHGGEMANIIEDLLVWARGDIGEVKINPEVMDLSASVRQTLRVLPQSELPLDEPAGPVQALADPSRVRQIVRNLASNALRYGGASIQVRVRSHGSQAILEVSDDGPEISADARWRMFEPYERAEEPSSYPGSIGLGLTVARTLARRQQGDLVFVREEGRNVFRLTLPLAGSVEDGAELDTASSAAR